MRNFLNLTLAIILLFIIGCSAIPNRAMIHDNNSSIDVTYYHETENENIIFAREFINSILKKNDLDEHVSGNIYFYFYKNIKTITNEWSDKCYGLTINVAKNIYEISILDYKSFISSQLLFYGFEEETYSDKIINLQAFEKVFYRSIFVHELTHAFLFSKGITDLAMHEYLAYAIEFMSIPEKYRNKLNAFLLKTYDIDEEEYNNTDFINEISYRFGSDRFGVLAYNHFKNHPETLKKILNNELSIWKMHPKF